MSSLVDVVRWSLVVEHRRGPLRPEALVALQREARALGLPGGSPAAIRQQAWAALASTVEEVHAELDAVPVTHLRAVLAAADAADGVAGDLRVSGGAGGGACGPGDGR